MYCETPSTAGAAVVRVKSGDTGPVRWKLPGFNLTGCTIVGALKRDDALTSLDVVIVDALNGVIEHNLPTLATGMYLVEFQVTETATSEVTHVPDEGYGQLIVELSFA